MEPPSPSLYIQRLQAIANIPKEELCRWNLSRDLTLERLERHNSRPVTTSCLEAFEYLRQQIRKDNYKLLKDPQFVEVLPVAFRRIKAFMKREKNGDIAKDFRLELIANLPLKQLHKTFNFDSETAYKFSKKEDSPIPLLVFYHISNKIPKLGKEDISNETVEDLTRLIFLLTDCFWPFLNCLLPKEKGSTNGTTLNICHRIFIPFANRLLEKENLTPIEYNFLRQFFRNSKSRIYSMNLAYYQDYWLNVFEKKCMQVSVPIEERLWRFFRICSFYSPCSDKFPSSSDLCSAFIRNILGNLPELIRIDKCKSMLKTFFLRHPLISLSSIMYTLSSENREYEILDHGFLVKDSVGKKIAEKWEEVLDELVSDPDQFLRNLFRNYAIKGTPLHLEFCQGPCFFKYPKYFLWTFQDSTNISLRKLLLDRIGKLNLLLHPKWFGVLQAFPSPKGYEEFLEIAKQEKNEELEEICLVKLADALSSFLIKPKEILSIKSEDLIKIIPRLSDELTKSTLFIDFNKFPNMTLAGIEDLAKKYPSANWLNFPFDRDSPLSNIILECKGDKLYMNSTLLSSSSDYFKALLCSKYAKVGTTVNQKIVFQLKIEAFSFFKRVASVLFQPTSNVLTEILKNDKSVENIKIAYKIVIEGFLDPFKLCFRNLRLATYYQIPHLCTQLDLIYTLVAKTWEIFFDPQTVTMVIRKDQCAVIFINGVKILKKEKPEKLQKYDLLKHTLLYKHFELEKLLITKSNGK